MKVRWSSGRARKIKKWN